MAPPYAAIFLGDLEERFFSDCDIFLLLMWRYIDNIFMLWQLGKKEIKKFLEIHNSCHSTIKFTANYLREKIRFSDIEVVKKENQLVTDLYINLLTSNNICMLISATFFYFKKSIHFQKVNTLQPSLNAKQDLFKKFIFR